jgi:hypothetical protein
MLNAEISIFLWHPAAELTSLVPKKKKMVTSLVPKKKKMVEKKRK